MEAIQKTAEIASVIKTATDTNASGMHTFFGEFLFSIVRARYCVNLT